MQVQSDPGSGFRIALAEDDHDLRTGLAALLEADGHQVDALASGAVLIEHLTAAILDVDAGRPDAIVTDVRMPGVSGLSIVEGLRANGWDAPIIIISAFADQELRERVNRLGGAVLFAKPFDPDELGRTLSQMLRGHRACAAGAV